MYKPTEAHPGEGRSKVHLRPSLHVVRVVDGALEVFRDALQRRSGPHVRDGVRALPKAEQSPQCFGEYCQCKQLAEKCECMPMHTHTRLFLQTGKNQYE